MLLKALALVLCITQFCYAIESEREIGGLTDETLTTTFDKSEDKTLAGYSETPDAGSIYQDTKNILRSLRYRLDIVPCKIDTPKEGQELIYKTVIYYSRRKRRYKCYRRPQPPYRTFIFDKNNRIIITPRIKNGKYYAQIIERYHINCPINSCELTITNMDLQGRVEVNGKMICLDYIQIFYKKANNTNEYCGNDNVKSSFSGSVDITFRSGPNTQRTGFMITIKVFTIANSEMKKGCLQENSQVSVEDYLQYNSVPIPRGGYGDDSDGGYTNDRYRGDYEDDRRTGEDDEDNWRFQKDYIRYRRNTEDKGPFREYEYNDYNDYKDIVQEMNQLIPHGAKQVLHQFYMENHIKALAESTALINEGIVRLATISVDSCDPSLSAIAQNVLSLFP